MTNFARNVVDDGTPVDALDVAGQAVRDFNHRSISLPRPDRDGWTYPSDMYRALGELTYLAGGLPQAFEQITAALMHQAGQGHIDIDRGTVWEGDPAGAVAAAAAALDDARRAAHAMYDGIAAAQNAISGAHYTGPVGPDVE